MRILLTGAAGFIGSNVLRELNDRGITNIVCVDDLTDGRKCARLAHQIFSDYVDFEELFLYRFSSEFDAIIHLGGNASTAAKDGRETIANNFTYTKRLIKLAEAHNCPIIYASSASVYGDGLDGFDDAYASCERPRSPYAVSKWLIDQYTRQNDIKVPTIGLRYFNVYGPGEEHKGAHASFAYKIFNASQTGETVKLFTGDFPDAYVRDFIYVQDAVNITLFFLTNPVSGAYNVGTGRPASFETVLKIGCETLIKNNLPIPHVTREKLPENIAAHYQSYTCASTSKLREMGWTANFTELAPGIARYYSQLINGDY